MGALRFHGPVRWAKKKGQYGPFFVSSIDESINQISRNSSLMPTLLRVFSSTFLTITAQ